MIAIIKRPEVAGLLLVFFLMQFSHGAYYAFFSIYMEQYEYTKTQIGHFWALAVLAEVVLFLLIPGMIKRYGAKKLMVASLVIAVIRWLVTAWYADSTMMIIVAQSMHAATFGLFHAVSIYLVHHYFTGKLQGRGQALYSSASFGAGGAAGSLASGYAWDLLGSTVTYLLAAGSVFIAVIVSLLLVRDVE
jgi:PPP family 3-phenylpropionic acid transporter